MLLKIQIHKGERCIVKCFTESCALDEFLSSFFSQIIKNHTLDFPVKLNMNMQISELVKYKHLTFTGN